MRGEVQAQLLAHALLHHPQAWPRQETALGLLISLRKIYQTIGVRHCLLGLQALMLLPAYYLGMLHVPAHLSRHHVLSLAPLISSWWQVARLA